MEYAPSHGAVVDRADSRLDLFRVAIRKTNPAGMSTAGLVLYLSSCGRTQRSAPTRRGSSSAMRFNRSQAESIFGRNVSVLEKYSVTLQYFIRRAEARLLLESAKQIFGTPTPQIIEKVDEATSDMLLAWTIRLRTAQSWNELITD
jgi:hypothetical protein